MADVLETPGVAPLQHGLPGDSFPYLAFASACFKVASVWLAVAVSLWAFSARVPVYAGADELSCTRAAIDLARCGAAVSGSGRLALRATHAPRPRAAGDCAGRTGPHDV
ncbi:hypothetical protein QE400_000622 [Xanthomonas sacchari]|uniref:hypothetical protein n=1 Tax=Xanthomonas sacchari TaxID=56458 RepID=UPI0027869138|nr:hypothetical protein [Xanthomonas sacchari]MDQ1091209.1 hypothetical protein [Xanthomonas sacchari]